MAVLEFPGVLANAAPTLCWQRLLIPPCVLYFPDSFVLDTVISRTMAGMKVDFSCHCSRGAGRCVCWTDTTGCTAKPRCE